MIAAADTTVMILAAGRGKRMGALTDNCPKPLLKVGDKALIEHHLARLASQGFKHIVINTAYLGEQLPQKLGDGSQYGVNITYSHEKALGLETAGGIINALPLLGDKPFIVINGDVWTDFDFSSLSLNEDDLAHLVLIPNPEHNAGGDFGLNHDRVIRNSNETLTFSGVGIYSPLLFANYEPGFRPLREPLFSGIEKQAISGELYHGEWRDIGTPERLAELDLEIKK